MQTISSPWQLDGLQPYETAESSNASAAWWPSHVTHNPHHIPSATPLPTVAVQGKRILVMGSGSGTNFEALTRALQPFGVEVAGVFCNRPKAYIIERAKNLGVPATVPSEEQRTSKKTLNDAVLEFLAQPFDLLLLAGYMRILPPRVVEPYLGKIINIHPSILPNFPGLHAIQQAWDAEAQTTGITVHWVDQGMDTGPIIAQASLPIDRNEPLESLEQRVHALEHYLYPWTVLQVLSQQTAEGETR